LTKSEEEILGKTNKSLGSTGLELFSLMSYSFSGYLEGVILYDGRTLLPYRYKRFGEGYK
jgi:hypothetical protein